MNRQTLFRLAASIAICGLAGAVGSIFTFPAIASWYASINKPYFTPPNWVFGPVWTALFLLMGIALFLVWEKGFQEKENKFAVKVFGAQLALNVLWSLLFFGLHNPFLAMIEIVALWLAIAATTILFSRIDRRAALLLLPYLAWVSFAAFLNYSVWLLNA
ncbi:MAG: tryptophan-rich sensory protein [Candidatus Diapherotrites archaeon]|nr:tryptophan-rich sensory protein [Candidatus Diapherotrites archaeon]